MVSSRVALVVEDRGLSQAVLTHLREEHRVHPFCATFAGIREHLDSDSDGLLLLAVRGGQDGQEALKLLQDIHLQKLPPMVVILDACGPESPLRVLEPYLHKHIRWPEESASLRQLLKDADGVVGFPTRTQETLDEILSRRLLAWTPSLLPLVERIALAAAHDVTVLLNGETGTGKTFLAKLIHDFSPRKKHRLLNIPCGAISPNLIESEFFGHVRGAFTGADRPKLGKFAAVGEGTLLLDEIDTLAPEQQATLLRVIETGEFESVGAVETQKCQARLIVASNIDLEEAVAAGRFRADLYFRLNVMSFHLPPLRERVQDIAPLARGMAARFNRKFNKDLFHIHPEAMSALEAFSWPGNIRQLENVIQHAVLLSSGPQLMLHHLPPAIQEQALPQSEAGPIASESLHHQRDVIERNVIQRALMTNGYSRTRAADSLGISRVTLYKKMKKYGLMKPTKEPAEVS
jgi:DNA-binding NtrC family response regulator